MPKLGESLRLNLQLFDGATNKFVRAWCLNDDGVLLSGTPLSLTHQGYGLYANKTISMPNTKQVKTVYRVYNDATFLSPSAIHSDAIDIFELEIAECAEHIIGYIETDVILDGYMEIVNLSGQVFLDVLLDGIVETDGVLSGELDIFNTLIGEIVEEDIVGEVECCNCDC